MKNFDFFVLALGICNLFPSCNSRNYLAANYSNDEKFRGVQNITIKNGPGNITVQPTADANNDETILELEGEERDEVNVKQEGSTLFVTRPGNPNEVLFYAPKPINITLYIAPTVNSLQCKMGRGKFSMDNFIGNLNLEGGISDIFLRDITGYINLDTGKSKFNIENITGNIDIHSGPIEQGNFQRISGNVNIRASQFNLVLFEIFGNINLRGAGLLNYTMLTKPNFPIFITFKGKNVFCNVYLSNAFRCIDNTIKGRHNNIFSIFPYVSGIRAIGDVNFCGNLHDSTLQIQNVN